MVTFNESRHPDTLASKARALFDAGQYRSAGRHFGEAAIGYMAIGRPNDAIEMGKRGVKAANRGVEEALEKGDYDAALIYLKASHALVDAMKHVVRH